MDLKNIITEKFDVPAVIIEVDHADVRKYSEENVFIRIEALLEEIAQER
jgi:benzoyl-CoA reductase/2-hydroxyglutaryl-CoA dehydratase subunit BcrC/BadD/HgdB